MSSNPEEWPEVDFTPPPPREIRERGDKMRRHPRTAIIIGGVAVAMVAATSLGTLALLEPSKKDRALDPRARETMSPTPVATPTTTVTATVTVEPTASQVQTAPIPQPTKKTLSSTGCLIVQPVGWQNAFEAPVEFPAAAFYDPNALSDGSVVVAMERTKKTDAKPLNTVSVHRFATPQTIESTELLRSTKGLFGLMADDQWVVWGERAENWTGVNGISAKPLNGGTTIRVTDERFMGRHKLSQGKVRWVPTEPGSKQVIRQFDLATKALTDMVELPAGATQIRLYDNYFRADFGDDSALFTMTGTKVATFKKSTSLFPIPGTQEKKWYRIVDNKLSSWTVDGGENPIPLPAKASEVISAEGTYVAWRADYEKIAYLTDTATNGTIALNLPKDPVAGFDLPRVDLVAGAILPWGFPLAPREPLNCP